MCFEPSFYSFQWFFFLSRPSVNFFQLIVLISILCSFQDKQDKNHQKGDFMFHTEHVVELVAKLLVQAESQQDMSAAVHVSER